jgi:transposase
VHDTKDETWRHLDFFQDRTYLHARTPRVTCPECGVRKAATPWARAGSGFTLLFEAYVLALAKAMPIANAAKRLGEHDTRLWRIVGHYVWRAVAALDLYEVRRIASTKPRRGAATTTSACSSTWRGARWFTSPKARTPRR